MKSEYDIFLTRLNSRTYNVEQYSSKMLSFLFIMYNYCDRNIKNLDKGLKYFFKYKTFKNWRERIDYITSRNNWQTKLSMIMRYGEKYGNIEWDEYRNKIAMTKENMIKKYGEVEGIERWEKYCKRQSETNTFEYKNKKYGMTKEEFNNYNRSRAVTLENMIKKYGTDEGTKKFNSYCEKQKVSGCKVEYFIDKYGTDEGLKKYEQLNNQKGLTLENFIRKYGEVEGEKLYHKHWNNMFSSNFYSKSSQELFDNIYSNLKTDVKEKCHYASLNKEFGLYDGQNQKYYFYDFVITGCINKVIEFNGEIWHADPKKYSASDVVPFINRKAEEVWESDRIKQKYIQDKGFKVLVIWEQDYVLNKEKIVTSCLSFIEE